MRLPAQMDLVGKKMTIMKQKCLLQIDVIWDSRTFQPVLLHCIKSGQEDRHEKLPEK